jgi:UDP-3-O-acyl N-acetylglucosamine deacetylase
MVAQFQKTLAQTISFSGRGVHSGEECVVTLLPAPVDHGVRFIRTDLPGAPEIPADVSAIPNGELEFRTVLCRAGDRSVSVQTVEHILAVLHGFGVNNARIEMTGPEVPIRDGSAGELARMAAECGVLQQETAARDSVTIGRPVSFVPSGMSGVEYTAWPSETLTLTFFLEHPHPHIGSQAASFELEPDAFTREIAPARTFCTDAEVQFLRSKGFIKGGEADNAIVVGDKGVLNTHLRWANEMARHKLLDLLGDLFLIGAPVRGHICAYRGGHNANAQFVRFLRKEFQNT